MRNKYLYAILLAFSVISLKTFAQNNNIIPASPEAGGLAKSINYPINNNTGVPNINIPLYELKAGELQLPVNISYHAGGFKVNEQYGNVGLGWSLSTDLQITVKINGLFDLTGTYGYIYNGIINSLGGYGSNNTSDNEYRDTRNIDFIDDFSTYENCWKIATNVIDLQPDEFYYKLLNKSGKFYFTPDGKIETVPYTGVKIELLPRGTNSTCQFQITDTDGAIYIFGDGLTFDNSKAAEFQSAYPYDISSWKCTRINSPSKADHIDFKYKIGETKYMYNFNKSIEFLSAENLSFGNPGDLIRSDNPVISGMHWQTSSGYTLKALYPLYTFSSPKYFSNVGSDAGLNLLNIDGNWVNYPQDPAISNYQGTRTLKLDNITYSGLKGNVVTLTYNYQPIQSNQLSSINITDGQTSQSISFMQSFVGWNSQNIQECNKTYYLDSVKTSNNDKYSFIYYNNNKVIFNNHSTGSDAWGGANRLTVDGLGNTTSTIKSLPFANFISNNYGNTTTAKIGSVDTLDLGLLSPKDVQVDESIIPKGVLEYISLPTGGRIGFEFGHNEYYDSVLCEKKLAGGLRINKIKNYKGHYGQDLVSQKIYKYGDNESGNGLIKNKFELSSNGILEGYYYDQQRKYIEIQGDDYNQSNSLKQVEKKTTMLPSTMVDMYYSSGSPIYYTEVAEYNEENGTISGKTVYKYVKPIINYYSNIFKDSTNIYVRNENWNKGQLESETYFKKSPNGFDTIKSKTYKYTQKIFTEIPVIQVFQNTEYWDTHNHNLLPDPLYNSQDKHVETYITKDDFTIVDYGLPVGDMLLTKEVEKTKDGTNEIKKVTDYYYDNCKPGMDYYTQLTRKETTLSNGKKLTDCFSYPQNYSAGTAFIDSLKKNYMQTALIEKITTINGKVIEGKLNTYLPDNTGHVTKTFELDPTLPLTLSNFNSIQSAQEPLFILDPSYFEKYSLEYADKRLAKITPKDNIPTSYYWGYHNTYPIIKAENVSYSDLNTAVINALGIIGKSTIDDLTSTIGNMTTSTQKNLYQIFMFFLKNNPLLVNAQLTTYTYSTLIGMTSQTDPKGMTIYYEYDSSQRLKLIKDQNSNIIKSYDYHYKQ